MISNERSSFYRRSPELSHHHSEWSQFQPKPPVNEDTIKTSAVQIERKTFILSLKENTRGRLLRITEETGGRRNSIIIPATGLAEFGKLVQEMLKASEEAPAAPNPQA